MGNPWLSIVGLADDSAASLPAASRAALDAAELIFGGPRHLELAAAGDRGRPWPVPFSVEPVLAARGRRVAVLASGDPFWYGAGGSLAAHLDPGDWRVFPAPSTFSLVAGALGWRLEEVTCHGLHAVPFARLRPVLTPKGRLICLVRDGAAPAGLAGWLTAEGVGDADLWVCECMGGANQRIRKHKADAFALKDIAAPVAMAVALPDGVGLPRASGLPDEVFAHDGQITKRPVRALTLSALAPRPGELLWDIGAGSGSISIEWGLAGGRAIAFERQAPRAENVAANVATFGLDHRIDVRTGDAAALLGDSPLPDAVFVGGGGTASLFDTLLARLESGTRLVANAVTLETEALLTALHATRGGQLLRIELAEAGALGRMRGWEPARPLTQWSVIL